MGDWGDLKNVLETKEKLNRVSSSFCLAKWLQVTVHLQNGQTHSCHHPNTHKIPVDELAGNPTALHNTNFKKLQRKAMLEGSRPPECRYCWNIEDTPGNHVSDRHFKSHDSWAMPHFDKVKNLKWDQDINPTYMEVSFSNICNFKCAYCAPHISSKWMEEIREYGPYPTSHSFNNLEWIKKEGKLPILESEYNPYVEAFWKWWPELYKNLEVFRITGGEPLMTRNTFRVLEHVRDNPNPDLSLAINSNLGVPRQLIEKFADLVEDITENNKVKNFDLFTSLDTWGPQAEYIRYGLKFDYFWENLRYLLGRLGKIKITFMCTFNALSVSRFKEFAEGVIQLKREFISDRRYSPTPVLLDTSYLRHPDHLSVKILTPDFSEKMADVVRYMEQRSDHNLGPNVGFYDFELEKMRRLHAWMKSPEVEPKLSRLRKDFYLYVQEYDRRRGTDFLKTFPEMAEFHELCRRTAEGAASQ